MRASTEDILRHRVSGPWIQLESRAQLLVEDARRHGGDSFQPVLGGGTRLMLALNHRISDDVDLFRADCSRSDVKVMPPTQR